MNRRPILLVGAVVIGAYLIVAAATPGLSGHHLLPLFEGVGPPPPYRWVRPPPAFAAGNTKPKPITIDIPLSGGKSPGESVTPDGQFVLNFGVDDFAPHGSDAAVRVVVTPVDPATLGPVPSGLAPDGNAYRVQLTYRPSASPVGSLVGAGDVFVSAPATAEALLYSTDGQSWSKLSVLTPGGRSSVASAFSHPGWYLAGANPAVVAVAGPRSNGLGTVAIASLVAALAILLAAGPIGFRAFRRRARRRPRPS